MKNEYQKYLDKYIEKQMKKVKKDFNKVINEVNEDLYKELVKMYDKLIDDFYQYKTTSYIRHGETRVGTQMGTTLYRGQDFKIVKGKNPKLIINFDADILHGGEREYRYDSPDHVFDLVTYGIRFPFGKNSNTWNGEYSGKYFSYKGTPYEIFKMFNKDYNNIVEKIFYSKWSKTDWK